MPKELFAARSQHHCVAVLFHSGTPCPVWGSESVLSAVSLQNVMKTLGAFVCNVMTHITQQRYRFVLLLLGWSASANVSGIFICFFYAYAVLLELWVYIWMLFVNYNKQNCIAVLAHISEPMAVRQAKIQSVLADLIFHCQLGQSSPSQPLSPHHITTYGQGPRAPTNHPSLLTVRALCGRLRWTVALSFPQHSEEHQRGCRPCVCSGVRGWVRILALSLAYCMEDYSWSPS